ncbi:MAG: HAD-IIIA family hydrolase [Cellvibrionaceae bacterium]
MKLALVSRDGVINEVVDGGVTHRTQLRLIDGSIAALAQLSKAGYTLIILTHQPGLSRGLFDLDELEAIHSEITHNVEEHGGEIAAIFYCPHDEQDRCHCRPPDIGLLDAIEMEFDCNTADAVYFYHSDNDKAMADTKSCKGFFCDTKDHSLINMIQKVL